MMSHDSKTTAAVDRAKQANEPPDYSALLATIATALHRSPFLSPKRWSTAVVVIRIGEPARVTSRADLAGFFTANALPQLARECIKRRVPRGTHILTWIEADHPSIAAAQFFVFDLASALRRSGGGT